MLSRPSLFARALEPLVSALWILFVLLSLIVACVWISDFGDAELSRYIANPGLRGALGIFLERLDAAWIALAAVVSYLALAEVEGLATVRRWGFIVIVLVALLAVVNSATSLPLGPLHYTARLGMQIGPVPFGLPLLWFALVTGARSVALRMLPRASHARVAVRRCARDACRREHRAARVESPRVLDLVSEAHPARAALPAAAKLRRVVRHRDCTRVHDARIESRGTGRKIAASSRVRVRDSQRGLPHHKRLPASPAMAVNHRIVTNTFADRGFSLT